MLNYPEFNQLARAYGGPVVSGVIKACPQDFKVTEKLSFVPSGEGEHRLINIRKTGLNTQDVAKQLARHAGLPLSRVSWAGLKDKHAVTEQWFGVHLVNHPEPDWFSLNNTQLEILRVESHQKKLKIGSLDHNHFDIRITRLSGDQSEIQRRLELIKTSGYPNYFDAQRFGYEGNNLKQAKSMFTDTNARIKRHQQSIYLSAARAYLFNAVLSQRVTDQSWNHCLDGELLMLNGTNSLFAEDGSEDIASRILQGDIHSTGPLFGSGDTHPSGTCQKLEQDILDQYPDITRGLLKHKMKAARRALRVYPSNLNYQIERDHMQISFSLNTGCYATTMLKELIA